MCREQRVDKKPVFSYFLSLKLFCPGTQKTRKKRNKQANKKAGRTLLHWSDEPSHVSAGLDCFILLLFYLIFNFTLEKRWLPTNGGLYLIAQTLNLANLYERVCLIYFNLFFRGI